MRNEKLVSFDPNTTKHHLFRLADFLGKLEALCRAANFSFTAQYPAVLASMIIEVEADYCTNQAI